MAERTHRLFSDSLSVGPLCHPWVLHVLGGSEAKPRWISLPPDRGDIDAVSPLLVTQIKLLPGGPPDSER